MDEESDQTENFCLDLVTQKRAEPFVLTLLRDRAEGEWVGVNEICQTVGLSATTMKTELVATWLPDPFGEQGFVVLIFYDNETKRSFAAHYNREPLLDLDAGH